MSMARGQPLDISLMLQWSSHKPVECPQDVTFRSVHNATALRIL